MPDESGTLSHEEQEWIVSKLNERFPDYVCPLSGKSNWGVAPHLIQLENYAKQISIPGDRKVYPSILLICKDCGLAYLLNAYQFGFLKHGERDRSGDTKNAK
jgi:hypothetical protein